MTAIEVAAAVRNRSASATEITRLYLERIQDLDPGLHAFQLIRHEKALAEAQALDQRGDLTDLPLAGVPIAVKDNMNVAGEPTRRGSAATPSTPVPADDKLVTRLRNAGAIVVGKTTMPELAIWGFTESAAFGVTRNPWNRDYSPGGSTGGGAAAVASGMAPLALASDGLGSIRGPSTYCGLFGLKPTRGLLPLMGDATEHWYGLSVTGPIATTVADAALMLDVLAGERTYRDVHPPEEKLRVALSLKPPTALARLAPEIRDAVRATGEALREAGHTVIEADPPYTLTLPNAILRRYLAGIFQDAQGLPWRALEKRTRTMARLGRLLGPGSPRILSDWAGKAAAWFRNFDIALMPAVALPFLPAAGWSGRGFVSTALPQIRALPYASAWNLAGFPAAAVPAGVGSRGIPLSVQLVTPAGGEELILSIAAQLEQLRPWPRLAP